MCKYEYKGEWYTREEMEVIYRTELANGNVVMDAFSAATVDETIDLEGDYGKMIQRKKTLASILQQSLAANRTRQESNSENIPLMRRLRQEQREMESRLNGNIDMAMPGLLDEIESMENAESIVSFAFYAKQDLDRLDQIMNNPSIQNIREAREIIDTYIKVGTFEGINEHLLFRRDAFTNPDGSISLPEKTRNLLGAMRDRAENAKAKMLNIEKVLVERLVAEDRGVQKTYKDGKIPTYNEFMHVDGLKDASWVDHFVMDISNGITSTNGILPQVMIRTIEHSMADKKAIADTLIRRLDELTPGLERTLTRLGHKLKWGTMTGYSYDVFRAVDSNGLLQDNIVQRYAPEFILEQQIWGKRMKKLIRETHAATDERDKQRRFKAAYNAQRDWLKSNTVVVDPALLPELINDPDLDGMAFGEPSEAHRQELLDLLGEYGYAKEVAKQKKLIKQYKSDEKLEIDEVLVNEGVSTVAEMSDLGQKQMEFWRKRNDPFRAARHHYTAEEILLKGNNVINAPGTTPLVDLGPELNNVSLYIDATKEDITIDPAMFQNAKEGDQVTVRNAASVNNIYFKDQISGSTYGNGEILTMSYREGKWEVVFDSHMNYNTYAPRKRKMVRDDASTGRFIYNEGEETNYYDKNFSQIEAEPDLREFHELLVELHGTVTSSLNEEDRENFSALNMFAFDKSLSEILLDPDPNMTLLMKISKVLQAWWERIKLSFGVTAQNNLSHAKISGVTGRPLYEVNKEFLKGNKKKIEERTSLELERILQANGMNPKTFKKYSRVSLNTFNEESLRMLAENLSVPGALSLDKAGLIQGLQKRLPNESINRTKTLANGKVVSTDSVSLHNILRSGIVNQIVAEQSFDLPKIMRVMADASMKYAARQEVLPILDMAKRHYEGIKDLDTNNLGQAVENANERGTYHVNGYRDNAVKQMNSWFDRVALGDYASKSEFGDTRIKRESVLLSKMTGVEMIDALTEKLNRATGATAVDGKILSKEEKILGQRMQDMLDKYREQLKSMDSDEDEVMSREEEHIIESIKALEERIDKLGKDFSAVAGMDAMFNFIRLKGLGWNVSSNVTNYVEGQLANMTIAASGDYFTPDNIYHANQVMFGSVARNVSFGYYEGTHAKLARVLMDRYDVLQDAANELQKASAKSAYSKSLNRLNPYEGTRRTEYLNQAPIMISMLMDEMITGASGETMSVWKAMDFDGKLKDDFATYLREDGTVVPRSVAEAEGLENFTEGPNITNWEQARGSDFKEISSRISKTIVNAHGDYSETRGNVATSYTTGKALLMFKRWMARQFYQRFAKQQDDIELGIKDYKGRFRSHTQGSGAIHGALLGAAGLSVVGFGPFGLVLGGVVGAVLPKFYGASTDSNKISFAEEAFIVLKEMAFNLGRVSINNLAGKPVVPQADLSRLKDAGLKERDIRNLKANLVDMSMTLAFLGMLFFTKVAFWDEDEEDKKSFKRMTYNYLANKFMQLSSQSSDYLSTSSTIENVLGSIAFARFLTDVTKTGHAASKFVIGKDRLAGGVNAGESGLANASMNLFLPSIGQKTVNVFTEPGPLFGSNTAKTILFDKMGDKQFQTDVFQDLGLFVPDKKEQAREDRAKRMNYKRELIASGMSAKDAQKKVDKEMPTQAQQEAKAKRGSR